MILPSFSSQLVSVCFSLCNDVVVVLLVCGTEENKSSTLQICLRCRAHWFNWGFNHYRYLWLLGFWVFNGEWYILILYIWGINPSFDFVLFYSSVCLETMYVYSSSLLWYYAYETHSNRSSASIFSLSFSALFDFYCEEGDAIFCLRKDIRIFHKSLTYDCFLYFPLISNSASILVNPATWA